MVKEKVREILDLLEIDPLTNISAECKQRHMHPNYFYNWVRLHCKDFAARWSAIKEKRGCSAQVDRSWRAYQRRKKSEAGIVHKKPAPL